GSSPVQFVQLLQMSSYSPRRLGHLDRLDTLDNTATPCWWRKIEYVRFARVGFFLPIHLSPVALVGMSDSLSSKPTFRRFRHYCSSSGGPGSALSCSPSAPPRSEWSECP